MAIRFIERKRELWNHFIQKHLQNKKLYRYIAHKKNGFEKYTIISACYNVEKYIDEYIKSLINQRLDFQENIFLICVDDGSTDRTATIIKEYANQYPKNIKYIYKKNGGQASARNLGMKYAKTEWVTFCDPDDLLEYNCFYYIDRELKKNPDVAMIAMNVFFYLDSTHKIKDKHSLNYKFRKKAKNRIKINKLKENIQLFVNSALFRMSVIKSNDLEQSQKVKPNFEDGHFISKYLACTREKYAIFLKFANYYYRKCSDGSSTLDKAWHDKKRFDDIFKYGYIDLLKYYKDHNIDNNYEKYVFIYDIMYHLRRFMDHEDRLEFLNTDEKKKYLNYIKECFSYFTVNNVESIYKFGLTPFWKTGIINCFLRTPPSRYFAYIEQYDFIKKELYINIIADNNSIISIKNNNNCVIPLSYKKVQHTYVYNQFVTEHFYWINFNDGNLSITVNGISATFIIKGKWYDNSININDIREKIPNIDQNPSNPYFNCWLLMDRSYLADDNAEHLYKWIVKNHPEIKIYFLLAQSSKDWKRLQSEGFNIIPFKSKIHRKALDAASVLISSHADDDQVNPFGNGLGRAKFVFLQHGVTKDDLHAWLNTKKIDLFVTATVDEYNSIIDERYKYKLSKHETKLLGFARYDNLFNNLNQSERLILIMPTWRLYLNKLTFDSSEYKSKWFSIFYSEILSKICEKYNYCCVICPHPNIRKFITNFETPQYIRFANNENYQQLFIKADILITDYSSTAFDMAYMRKPIIYYQFDEKEFFSGNHTYQKGYFDYHKNGFGPVLTKESEIYETLENILQSNSQKSEYLEREEKIFAYFDANNCQRNFDAILKLLEE